MLQLMFRIHADCATDDASAQALQQRLLQALAPWNATRRFAPEHSERFPGRCNFSFDLPFVPGAFAAITAIGDTGWDHSSNDTNDDGGPVRSSVWNRHDEPRTLLLPEVAWAELLDYDTEWERFNLENEFWWWWNGLKLRWAVSDLGMAIGRGVRALKAYRSGRT